MKFNLKINNEAAMKNQLKNRFLLLLLFSRGKTREKKKKKKAKHSSLFTHPPPSPIILLVAFAFPFFKKLMLVLLIVFSILFHVGSQGAVKPCSAKIYGGAFRNQVCVCNATYCDTVDPIGDIASTEAVIYKSSLAGDRLRRIQIQFTDAESIDNENATIFIDTRKRYQKIFGFGGAFTDSAGNNLAALSDPVQHQLLNAYFGADGIEYNVGRVPIASCDFSTREYSYVETKDDFELNSFELAKEDFKWKIPFIKQAKKLSNGNLKLFASPWSSPGWMKVTGSMKGGGSLRNDSRIFQSYANYFVKFFEEYQKELIDFWGVTIQNEPSTGDDITWRWQTLNFTAETMRDFLKNYLGPTLKNNSLTKSLKVMILDDSRGFLPAWADATFNDSTARDYADGIAIHWYGNAYSLPYMLDITHHRHPDKFILATEACAGFAGHHGPIMGDWFRAEAYADDIITDLNHFVTGWTDWNLCLDEDGGPNWVLNLVDSPIIVNRTAQEFYKQPMFYAMGHFSKFMPRGSIRVKTHVTGSRGIVAASVIVIGGRRVTVVVNKKAELMKIRIVDVATNQSAVFEMAERSIYTIIWNKKK